MQIKRFEAADMAEALRQVRREFGENAVILSAKQVRAGGLLNAFRKKAVEITAATDYPDEPGPAAASASFTGMLSREMASASENDRVSLSTSPAQAAPGRTGHLPGPESGSATAGEPPFTGSQRLAAMPSACTVSWPGQAVAVAESDGPVLTTFSRIVPPFYRHGAGRKTIALVGPAGVGKSTTVAKLAQRCHVVGKKRTAVISLDRFRIGGNALLERSARIMGFSFRVVHDCQQLQQALEALTEADVLLIDTPGLGASQVSMMAEVGALLRAAGPDETHLVLNATVREAFLAAAVKAFGMTGVNRVILTHMDEFLSASASPALLDRLGLPSAFSASGADLFDDLQELVFSPMAPAAGALAGAQGRSGAATDAVPTQAAGTIRYVANRNSELFHQLGCKSVKRINAENIAGFSTLEQAMEAGFKPCRACCEMGKTAKPMPRNADYAWSRAM